MPCCKSKGFKWCKDLKIVHTDEEGKEYCVFHAPKGKKGVATVVEFNESIFQRIQEANEAHKTCDLSNSVLSTIPLPGFTLGGQPTDCWKDRASLYYLGRDDG